MGSRERCDHEQTVGEDAHVSRRIIRISRLSRSIMAAICPFVVGGRHFPLALEDVLKHDTSKLTDLATPGQPTVIDRDGQIFEIIYAYLINGYLIRDKDGNVALEPDELARLKAEAEFYGLPKLLEDCVNDPYCIKLSDLETYQTTRELAHELREQRFTEDSTDTDIGATTVLTKALAQFRAASQQHSPMVFCLHGELAVDCGPQGLLYGSHSTVHAIDVEECLQAASVSPFGRGTATVVDPTVRNSQELPASALQVDVLNQIREELEPEIANLMRDSKLQLKPYKLVIYQQGGHFDQHRDTVRGEGHIGTLVLILNSAYTGGELEITHGGRTEVVTGPYHWVAMYGDCLHKINLVLYDLLTKDPHLLARYEVQVVHCAINYFWDRDARAELVNARLFTTFEASALMASARYTSAQTQSMKFVIPGALNQDSILDYDPQVDYMGNESSAEETVYVVAGLQVRRRE